MTVVKINAITVREGSGDELARRFAKRAGRWTTPRASRGSSSSSPTTSGTSGWWSPGGGTRRRSTPGCPRRPSPTATAARPSGPGPIACDGAGAGSRSPAGRGPQRAVVLRHRRPARASVTTAAGRRPTRSRSTAAPSSTRPSTSVTSWWSSAGCGTPGRGPTTGRRSPRSTTWSSGSRVRIADLTITEAGARHAHLPPHRVPGHRRRPSAGLVGLSVTRGYTREVQARFGGPKGCTHLEQLARSLGPVVVQAVTSRRARAVSRGRGGDLVSGGGSPWARDSCHIWAEGGVADQKLAAGWRPGTGPYPAPAARDVHRAERHRREPGAGRAGRRPARPSPAGWRSPPWWRVTVLSPGCTASGTAISTPFATARPVLEHGPHLRGQGGHGRRPGPGAGRRPGHHPLPVRDRPPGLAVPVLRHLRRAVAAAHPPDRGDGTGGRTGDRARAARHRPPDRRDHPDHLQRLAALPVAAGPAPGKATGQAPDQRRWAVVRGRPGRQRRHDRRERTQPRGTAGQTGGHERSERRRSRWSINSTDSILSINSTGSILSIGRSGRSSPSDRPSSVASVGSFLGVASILSCASVASVLSFRSPGRCHGRGRQPGRAQAGGSPEPSPLAE